MTEAEWLACADLRDILGFLRGKGSQRKQRLFACACCRRAWGLLAGERWRDAVLVAERFADGRATADELAGAREADWPGAEASERVVYAAGAARASVSEEAGEAAAGAAWDAAQALCVEGVRGTRHPDVASWQAAWVAARVGERRCQWALLGDLFANPLFASPLPVALDPAWRTRTALQLAQGIYDARAFDRLPILADALEEAGCTDTVLLSHCRGPGPHALGCWVVDLLLGKE
jgi:hypothetical protein